MNKKIENFILIIFILIVMGSFFSLSRYIIFIPKFKDLKNIKSEPAVLQNKQYNIWFLKNNWQYESINCLVDNFVESEIKTLGSFEKMLKNTPYNPITHGILYIYKK